MGLRKVTKRTNTRTASQCPLASPQTPNQEIDPMDNLREIEAKLLQIKTLTDECLRELGRHPKENRKSKKNPAQVAKPGARKLDFSKPVRPFMKSYSQGMNGKKMTAIMEMDFNRFFTSKARDEDWVESSKGQYKLRPGWKAIFN